MKTTKEKRTYIEIRAFCLDQYRGKWYIVVYNNSRHPLQDYSQARRKGLKDIIAAECRVYETNWMTKDGLAVVCRTMRFPYDTGVFGSVREALGVIRRIYKKKNQTHICVVTLGGNRKII
jgi:hypothetical protein